jgi:steroid 5-alpha reductase family enzyme
MIISLMEIFYYLIISVLFNLIMFVFAFKFKTDKLTDISYALSFIFLAVLGFCLNDKSLFKLVLLTMVLLWAFRIGFFLFIRINKNKKDKRFDGIRENFFSFLKFWVLQGVSVWVILIPSILFFISKGSFSYLMIGGFIVWACGLLIETVSDIQKYNFNKSNPGKFISIGLWKYSRHPNYFGEILCWVGIYIYVFSSLSVIGKFSSLISPLFISVLLIFVSGIPLLEKYSDKKWGKNKEYVEYKKRTSVLIPWFVGK